MRISLMIIVLLFTCTAYAEQVVYPAKGQSPEQQKKDEADCYIWAVDYSGYDPANPPAVAAPSTQPTGPTGARLRGAARGAVIGEIADGDVGDAALAGAVMGGSRERRERRFAQQQTQASSATQQQAGLSSFNKARAACLEGRSYSVK